jgi:hypothetical protein
MTPDRIVIEPTTIFHCRDQFPAVSMVDVLVTV